MPGNRGFYPLIKVRARATPFGRDRRRSCLSHDVSQSVSAFFFYAFVTEMNFECAGASVNLVYRERPLFFVSENTTSITIAGCEIVSV